MEFSIEKCAIQKKCAITKKRKRETMEELNWQLGKASESSKKRKITSTCEYWTRILSNKRRWKKEEKKKEKCTPKNKKTSGNRALQQKFH